ncbi:MAG: ABC transporter ATP-binding protein, partial [Treponema sp.]|nr:ABC transporter ATP-binding protein [Treponema sp.]
LSPGELRKLMIALAVQKPLSLLILDEPTNHMDITSILALENALASLDCAMIVVSHDKTFLGKVTNESLFAERKGKLGEIRSKD